MAKGTEGIVIDKLGERVKVRIYRARPCNACTCGLAEACDPNEVRPRRRLSFLEIFGGSDILEVEALNDASAQPGDRCVVMLKSDTSVLKGSLLLYLLPGILFILGLFAGGLIGERAWGLTGDSKILAQLAGGLILMFVSFFFAAAYGKLRARSEFMPIVTKVIKSSFTGSEGLRQS